jgi:hypothetical protein
MINRARWLGLVGTAALLGVGMVNPTAVGATPSGEVHAAGGISGTLIWSATEPDNGNPIAESSPSLATLDGQPAVVVGDRAGHLYAFNLTTGSELPGWPVTTPGSLPVDSTASSSDNSVYIGVGNAGPTNSEGGGYLSLTATGGRRWYRQVSTIPGRTTPLAAIQAGLTVGDLQGGTDVYAGGLAQEQYALNAANGATLTGWPFFSADSNFSTAAIGDLYGDGQNELVEGGDSTAGNAYGVQYSNGGHVRVLSSEGRLLCDYDTSQTVDSSPAVGQFLSGGAVGIVVGTGSEYHNAPMDQVLGLTNRCGLTWTATLDGTTQGSPALVDALGNGGLQVAEGTITGRSTGSLWLLNGANGATIWKTTGLSPIYGSPVTVDLGQGYQDLLVAVSNGFDILDGRTGSVVFNYSLPDNLDTQFQNTPLVTNDPGGSIGVTLAGYDNSNAGAVFHVELQGTGLSGATVGEAGSWPMFHHDSQLTGDAGTPARPCTAPTGPAGYYFSTSVGEVFNYGNLPFCGQTNYYILNKPVVGMTATPNGGGYWQVASDGGIFAFGNARFLGSTGGITLNKPVVGMTATTNSEGYWLVASDGGIFAYGNARFLGSTGGITLNKPVVAIGSTPTNAGYWMVASDGGVFNYGDARFYGSTGALNLTAPVVAMSSL